MIIICFFAWFDLLKLLYRGVIVEIVGTNGNCSKTFSLPSNSYKYNFGCLGI